MKPFSLEEYLKNPKRKVVTGDGKNVRIICTDKKSSYPIVALITTCDGTSEEVVTYTKNGEYFAGNSTCKCNLLLVPEKYEGWINVYSSSYFSTSARIFSSEEEAKKEGKKWKDYVATVKIEWEN